jgi:hypothetical protein
VVAKEVFSLFLSVSITKRQHARMPQFILGVGITEPAPTRRAVYGRREGTIRRAR